MIRQAMLYLRRASALCFVLLSLTASSQAQDKAPEPATQRIAFANVYVKSALSVLGKNIKLQVKYDATVKNEMVEVEFENVTITHAMTALFEKHKLRACVAEDEEEETILVFADTEENRKKYARHKPWPAKPNPEK